MLILLIIQSKNMHHYYNLCGQHATLKITRRLDFEDHKYAFICLTDF